MHLHFECLCNVILLIYRVFRPFTTLKISLNFVFLIVNMHLTKHFFKDEQ